MHRHAIVSLILTALLAYGGLYPLHGWHTGNAIAFLTEQQPVRSGLDDLLVNVLVFMPLGFTTLLALGHRYRPGRSLLLALLHGFMLSFAIEAFQAFLPMRYSSITDLAMNTLGTALGAGTALWYRNHGHQSTGGFGRAMLHDPAVRLVLMGYGAWALAPLLPLDPVADMAHLHARLHQLAASGTPARPWSLGAGLTTMLAVFALGQLWRTTALPAARVYGVLLLPVLARLLIGERGLPADQALGTLLGLGLLWALPKRQAPISDGDATARHHALLAGIALVIGFVLMEVLPGTGAAYRSFNWIPFRPHLQNPVLGIESLLEVIWIAIALAASFHTLMPAGRWVHALAAVAVLGLGSLLLELNQVRLPGRSPDVTSAIVMALTCLLSLGAAGMFRRGRTAS